MMLNIALIFIVGVFLAIALGFPTVYALGTVSLLFLVLQRGINFPPEIVILPMVDILNKFALLAVPLFFFVGRLMNESGLTDTRCLG